jgi:hypothetical protein
MEKFMRKSLFYVAAATVVVAACAVEQDLTPAEPVGPFGMDLSGTYILQTIATPTAAGILPFMTSSATTTVARNFITAGQLLINYDVEKSFNMRLCYSTQPVTPAGSPIAVKDSSKTGVWYSTTDTLGVTNFSLLVYNPVNGFFVGATSGANTTLSTGPLTTTFGNGQATTQTWTWQKTDIDPIFARWKCPP